VPTRSRRFWINSTSRPIRVDYILGAKQHGGGVYVVGRCDSEFQTGYLKYYKVSHRPPYFLLFRPYHLCHVETPRAIALAALYGKAVCNMRKGRVTDCYAYAKRPLKVGDRIEHAIGSDEIYGLIMAADQADSAGLVPQGVLDAEGALGRPIIRKSADRDEPLTWENLDLPELRVLQLWELQRRLHPIQHK
jgi:predicted homoserine dehydrogenase-like protein